jgi:hypothetical protein
MKTWFAVLALTLTALLIAAPQFKAADTLPSQISDEAFWKMIEDYSEDNGFFTSENFSSNERGYQTLIPRLMTKIQPGGAYMGVGPEQNFQYIASLKPKIAFIVDIRRQNMIQHLMYKAAFEMAANRADFLSIVFSRKRPTGLSASSTVPELFTAYRAVVSADAALAESNRKAMKDLLTKDHKFRLTPDDLQTLDHVFDVFAKYGAEINYSARIDGTQINQGRGGANNAAYAELMILTDSNNMNRSYLASEDSYGFMKDFEKKNLLVPVVGNFGGPKALRAVGQYFKDHGAIVSLFYLSNVEQYLFNPPQGGGARTPIHREFYENVATFPLDENSTFIRSGNGGGGRGGGGGLTPVAGSIQKVISEFKAGRVNSQQDVLALSDF